MLRPGKHFVRLIGILAALALLVTVFVPLVWAIVAALAVLVLLAAAESVLLLRVRFTGERPAKIALALDEVEPVPLEIRTTASRPLRLIVRQTWPDTVEARASERVAVCNPGEVVSLEMPVRAIARGSSTVLHPWVASPLPGLVGPGTPRGTTFHLHVLTKLPPPRRRDEQPHP